MKLPNIRNVIIPKKKLKNYLLSLTNKDGRPKAEYFRKIGFNETNIEDFKDALLAIISNNEVKAVEKSKFGVKYVIEGLMNSPTGKKVMVRTIWSIDKGKKNPRLVTAYRV